ncbi:MAG: uracil phosphoribosyltransferase [bacterium]|nr:uracil phosphoribosyltransferase [bacterium]
MPLHVLDHPLIRHKLTLLRDKNTGSKDFRELVSEVAALMAYEATRDLPVEEVDIETPIAKTKGIVISGRKLAIVPILRAGLGMVDGIGRLIPAAKIGHIGLYRENFKPVEYFCKLPPDLSERDILLLDPMLATGGSAAAAIQLLHKRGAVKEHIKFLCLVASPEGLDYLQKAEPEITIYTTSVDERLNDNKYIVPGLGDAGDRIFGTL